MRCHVQRRGISSEVCLPTAQFSFLNSFPGLPCLELVSLRSKTLVRANWVPTSKSRFRASSPDRAIHLTKPPTYTSLAERPKTGSPSPATWLLLSKDWGLAQPCSNLAKRSPKGLITWKGTTQSVTYTTQGLNYSPLDPGSLFTCWARWMTERRSFGHGNDWRRDSSLSLWLNMLGKVKGPYDSAFPTKPIPRKNLYIRILGNVVTC